MKKKIEKYKYEKVIDSEFEIDIPEVPEFYFQTGIRRAIAVLPQWTSWNKEHLNKEEEVYEITFICVYVCGECKIERSTIRVNSLSDFFTREKEEHFSLQQFLANRDSYPKRTQEKFLADYSSVIVQINRQILGKDINYRYDWQDIDEKDNKPDLQNWVNNNEMVALIDEVQGGIVGYIHSNHIGRIVETLNNNNINNQIQNIES